MANVSIPSLKWGKRKERSQMLIIMTADRRAVREEWEVLTSCADSEERGRAFLLNPLWQYEYEGAFYQIVDENSQIPMTPYSDETVFDQNEMNELSDDIYSLSQQDILNYELQNMKKNDAWDKFIKIFCVMAGVFLIFGALHYFGG